MGDLEMKIILGCLKMSGDNVNFSKALLFTELKCYNFVIKYAKMYAIKKMKYHIKNIIIS